MKPDAIHQIVAGFTRDDAISNEALSLRSVFRKWGYTSNIYSETKRVLPELRSECKNAEDLHKRMDKNDAILLHLSIGSAVNDIFSELKCRKALLYHNITPPDFFRGLEEQTAHNLARGREQLAQLAGQTELSIADSRFNASEMEEAGYRNVNVFPLLIDFEKMKTRPDSGTIGRYSDGKTNIVFVGRCAPNKKIEHILQTFICYQRAVNPESRLIITGSYAGLERYHALLSAIVHDTKINNVIFTGKIPQKELNAVFTTAHVFLCMSEHEGFCAPIIESMAHDVPVIAYSAGAVPETMDKAGILFTKKEFPAVAELAGTVTENTSFRNAVLEGQRTRIRRFMQRDIESELRAVVGKLLE